MVLLVNPWIYDFSAYDMWMMPLGLLRLGTILKKSGMDVILLDLLSFDTTKQKIKRKPTGEGKLPFEVIETPKVLKIINKKYKRYGISPDEFREKLEKLPEPPDAIFVTSKMTYWYPGVRDTVNILRDFFPNTKVVLGGTYATLIPEHAGASISVHMVIPGDIESHIETISKIIGHPIPRRDKQDFYEIDLSLLQEIRFLPLLSSIGCPFNCTYCASRKLFPNFTRYSPEKIVEQVLEWSEKYNCIDITIFDDAFLANKNHAKRILQLLSHFPGKFRIHTPNAIHVRYIDQEMADLLKFAGIHTLRLGLESIDHKFQNDSGAKVFNDEFIRAVKNLHRAGFNNNEIGTYIMAGLPFQKKEEVEEAIKFVMDSGAKPKLVEYSPVPKTPLFEEAKRCTPFDLNEPLFQNNSILPCQWQGFTYDDYREIKLSLKNTA